MFCCDYITLPIRLWRCLGLIMGLILIELFPHDLGRNEVVFGHSNIVLLGVKGDSIVRTSDKIHRMVNLKKLCFKKHIIRTKNTTFLLTSIKRETDQRKMSLKGFCVKSTPLEEHLVGSSVDTVESFSRL